MQNSPLALLTGLLLGLAVVIDGFSGFLTLAVLGGLGLLVGRVLDGDVDLQRLTSSVRDRR